MAQPLSCLNAKAMEYHKFVYAGHQHADHQLWAAGICGLLRKSVRRLILRSSSWSRAFFASCQSVVPLSTTAIKGMPHRCVVTCWIHTSSISVELNTSRRSEKWWLRWRARSRSMVDGEISCVHVDGKCRCRVRRCAAGNRPHLELGQWNKECQGQAWWDDYVTYNSTAEEFLFLQSDV